MPSFSTATIARVVWIHVGVALALTALRLGYRYFGGGVRKLGVAKLWWDDGCLVLAMAALIGNGVLLLRTLQYDYELDKDPPVPVYVPRSAVLNGSVLGTLNAAALAFSKTALALLLGRLTEQWPKWYAAILASTAMIDVLYVVQAWTYWASNCREAVLVQWYRAGARCHSPEAIIAIRIVVQVASCALDAFYTFVPWKIVHRLSLRKLDKFGIAIAMSLGIMSCATGLVRVAEIATLLARDSNSLMRRPFWEPIIAVWNFIEPADTIIAACMPVMRAVADTILPFVGIE
ncbi:hypothetical protein GGR56DRAFT_677638 [Xylariaceae sp. FL0804]|nr:hypothetical protein GGR56DRAFT_677638 [Xylariaceae sp. FL0804]